MKKIYQRPLSSALLVSVLGLCLASCVTTATLQTARTTPKGHVGGGIGGSVMITSGSTDIIDEDVLTVPLLYVSSPVMVRYGLTNRLDMGLRIGGITLPTLDAKYMLLGDHDSKTALSIGASVGGAGYTADTGDNSRISEFSVPVYASLYPTNWLALYVTPRFIGRYDATLTNGNNGRGQVFQSWMGGTAGIRLGKRFGVVTEFSSFPVYNENAYRLF
ncbi:MAG TPA: hypothetical protein DCR93_13545, partial [Cytophagales bacterium]|nr:hypothetical protein [Cytophagales bacterium]